MSENEDMINNYRYFREVKVTILIQLRIMQVNVLLQ